MQKIDLNLLEDLGLVLEEDSPPFSVRASKGNILESALLCTGSESKVNDLNKGMDLAGGDLNFSFEFPTKDLQIPKPTIELQLDDFEEQLVIEGKYRKVAANNAVKKAKQNIKLVKADVPGLIYEDTSFFCPAIDGNPDIGIKRWCKDDKKLSALCSAVYEGLSLENSQLEWALGVAISTFVHIDKKGDKTQVSQGTVMGYVSRKPQYGEGDSFGFDPIFIPIKVIGKEGVVDNSNFLTLSQMSDEDRLRALPRYNAALALIENPFEK